MTEEDTTDLEQSHTLGSRSPPCLRTCRMLARASLLLSVCALLGPALYILIKMGGPDGTWEVWVLVVLPAALLAFCLVLWVVMRVLSAVLSKDMDHSSMSARPNYGGSVAYPCIVFCVLVFTFGPFALVSILFSLGGN